MTVPSDPSGRAAWHALEDELDIARTQANVLRRMFGADEGPTKLGRFSVTGTLGAGEMGRVYLARDPELERDVALKVIRHFGDNPEVADKRRARLLREARAMARVHHPNVIAIFEVGRLGEDVFIVMEHAAGGTLRDWMEERSRSWREVVVQFGAAASGLAAAHRKQVVHRDFKPDNVLVTDDGRTLVADFGLAFFSKAESESGEVTGPRDPMRTTRGAGTPGYMAPEQLCGQLPDARSDQFSFFVSLYEALHGRRPFAATSPAELDPAAAASLEVSRGLPTWLQALLRTGLSASPDDRHNSMTIVADQLKRRRVSAKTAAGVALGAAALVGVGGLATTIAGDDSVSCASAGGDIAEVWSASLHGPLRKALSERSPAFGATTAERITEDLDDYAARWKAARREACEATHARAEQSAQVLDLRVACLNRRRSALQGTTSLLLEPDEKTTSRAVDMVNRLPAIETCSQTEELLSQPPLPDDPSLRGQLQAVQERLDTAWVAERAGRYDDAKAQLDALDPDGVAASHDPLQAEILKLRGFLQSRSDDPEFERTLLDAVSLAEASRHDRIAASCWQRLALETDGSSEATRRAAGYLERFGAATARLGNPPRLRAQFLWQSGLIAARKGEMDLAMKRYTEALEAAPADVLPDINASIRLDIASTHFRAGDYAAAARGYGDLRQVYVDVYGAQHPLNIPALNNLGMALISMGENQRAIPPLTEAMEIGRAVLGGSHRNLGTTINALASAYYQMGDFDAAAPLYDEAVRISEEVLGPDDTRLAPSLANVARVASARGEHDAAIAAARRAVGILERAGDANEAHAATIWAALGFVLSRGEQYAAAEDAHRQALKVRAEKFGAQHNETAYSHRALADTLEKLKRPKEALEEATRARSILEKNLDPAHPQVASALLTEGRIALSLGDAHGARQLLERSVDAYSRAEAPPDEKAEAARLRDKAVAADGR